MAPGRGGRGLNGIVGDWRAGATRGVARGEPRPIRRAFGVARGEPKPIRRAFASPSWLRSTARPAHSARAHPSLTVKRRSACSPLRGDLRPWATEGSACGKSVRKRDGSSGALGTSAPPRPLRGPRTRPVQSGHLRSTPRREAARLAAFSSLWLPVWRTKKPDSDEPGFSWWSWWLFGAWLRLPSWRRPCGGGSRRRRGQRWRSQRGRSSKAPAQPGGCQHPERP